MISAQNVYKHFGSDLVLSEVSISVDESSIVVIVGPSGSGKTTLLNVLAGMVPSDSGTVRITEWARLGYMLQQSAMLPWRTLGENARLGLEIMRPDLYLTGGETLKLFQELELIDAENKFPDECSIGMKQLAAFIRTLAIRPNVLLLDEPFASLDYDIKLRAQIILASYVKQHQAAVLLVTHDLEDAIAMADRVIVMSRKPGGIKVEIPIELGLKERNPIAARTSPRFREYFETIWQELKYLQSP